MGRLFEQLQQRGIGLPIRRLHDRVGGPDRLVVMNRHHNSHRSGQHREAPQAPRSRTRSTPSTDPSVPSSAVGRVCTRGLNWRGVTHPRTPPLSEPAWLGPRREEGTLHPTESPSPLRLYRPPTLPKFMIFPNVGSWRSGLTGVIDCEGTASWCRPSSERVVVLRPRSVAGPPWAQAESRWSGGSRRESTGSGDWPSKTWGHTAENSPWNARRGQEPANAATRIFPLEERPCPSPLRSQDCPRASGIGY